LGKKLRSKIKPSRESRRPLEKNQEHLLREVPRLNKTKEVKDKIDLKFTLI
jgi:hypothetical protein